MYRLSNDELLSLYVTMKKIRMTEEKIEKHYGEDNMHTPVHLYIGQEAIAAGVCFNLKVTDKIYSNHRNHGHYLAKGGNLKAMIAELHNKKTGCSGGYGGSMHLVDNSVGFPITSSIVAGGVPIGTGNALASQMRKESNVTVVFFGDAASEEGVVYESMAFAELKRLPVVYVCENNLFSVGTPFEKREPRSNISDKFKGILPVTCIDGNDVLTVQHVSGEAIQRARNGGGPTFIECKTYRMKDHHGTKTGVEAGYQTREEWDSWLENCPIKRFEELLINRNILTKSFIETFENDFEAELKAAFQYAEESPLPDIDELCKGIFA